MARYSRSRGRRTYSASRSRRSYSSTRGRRRTTSRRRSARSSRARTIRIVVQAASPSAGLAPQSSVVPLRAMF